MLTIEIERPEPDDESIVVICNDNKSARFKYSFMKALWLRSELIDIVYWARHWIRLGALDIAELSNWCGKEFDSDRASRINWIKEGF